MSKTILFCADGTWDSPSENTNVYSLYKAALIDAKQVTYYDDGVGSDGSPLEKLNGGAFGEGLLQKIKDGYTKIAHVYEKDDDIFICGFSRGAYTARSLAGMIAVCGLPTANFDDDVVNDAFDVYRERDPAKRAAALAALGKYGLYNAKIKMVGVWDTVGALGIPALFGGVDMLRYGFLDTNLHPDVLNAFQALSIDERRQEFPATLWTLPNPPTAGQNVTQIWFAGVHCDVGGGYPETGLSDITLRWMMTQAASLGLRFDPAVFDPTKEYAAEQALEPIHESWTGAWLLPKSRVVPANAMLANSVVIRCKHDTTYTPGNLVMQDSLPSKAYTIAEVVEWPDE